MKKYITAVLILIMTFSLVGCGKSEEATAVDNKIMTIEVVSLDSGQLLKTIADEIDALDEKDKKKLENLFVFNEAMEEFSKLSIAEADRLIAEIGTVTLDSKDEIKAAEKFVNSMFEDDKAKVSRMSDLNKAIEKFDSLSAQGVIDLINDIGEVTTKKGAKIKKAEKAYDKLSDKQKALVTNYSELTKARSTYEKKLVEERQREGKAALNSLDKDYDQVEGITWYDKFPYYIDTRSYVLPYIGVGDDGSCWMNIRYNYTGDSWVFWEKVIIVVDGKRYEKTTKYSDITHDNYIDVWEYADLLVNDDDIEMLNAIADSKQTIVRFKGDDRHHDFTIKDSDKKIIKKVLKAYDYVKNQ